MGVPNLEVGYTSATTGRGDHEVHKGHVVVLGGGGSVSLEYFGYHHIFSVSFTVNDI
jgi:hypothetical protein